MKATKEQIEKWEKGLAGGWEFDQKHYEKFGEKTVKYTTPRMQEGKFSYFFVIYLGYLTEFENWDNKKVYNHPQKTGMKLYLRVGEFYVGAKESVYFKNSIIRQASIGIVQKNRNYKYMQQMTQQLNIDKILKFAQKSRTPGMFRP